MLRTLNFITPFLLLFTLALNSSLGLAQEQQDLQHLNAPAPVYLISMGKKAALNRMLYTLSALNLQEMVDFSKVENKLTSAGEGYSYFQETPYLTVSVDGFTGSVDVWRHIVTEANENGDIGFGNPASTIRGVEPPNPQYWQSYLKNRSIDVSHLSFLWYSQTDKFTMLSLIQEEDNFVDHYGLLLRSDFDISKADGSIYKAKVNNIIEWRNTIPTITFDQAMDLANWLVEANDHTVLRAPSQFNAKQKQFWDPLVRRMPESTAYYFYALPRIEIRRDKWLMLRPEWDLDFGNFSIRLNAETGRPVGNSYRSFIGPINDPSSIYHVDEIVSHEKPDWYVSAQEEKLPKVIFNDEIVEVEMGALHFSPLVREENPLIFADYFPKFLIDAKREGDTITLRGQLPNKGKTAVLTLGSKQATVDGQPFTLSGAPQEIDGRLYLPYELLHECNGVLVRWDAKKNTLWVDTRYLRRP